jgi:hypothetical protein
MYKGENKKNKKWGPLVNSACPLRAAPGSEA